MKAARIVKVNEPLQVKELQTPKPKGSQTLIKVWSSGVCHSSFLRIRARLVLVGLFGGELRLSLVTIPARAYKIIGSYTGSLEDMVELVSLAERGAIKLVVSNRFKLDQAGEALQMLKDGKIVVRGIINP
jgi:D-arabinose 1-dehydrogenase-like Zn-dependent alcohol dehydrogenase